jgi:N-methylhydantoinase A
MGFASEFYVMLSNGGIMNADYAGKYAVYSLLSGPAGGVVACSQLIGELASEPDIITVDMGGTSYDIALIRGGKPTVTTERWVSRYRAAVPMLDIHTIGAGGGSIAWMDPGGALQVGPRSAGAEPGPACYGRGGKEPTVTDANLLLGFLDPETFLGGEMKLDRAEAERVVRDRLARPLGIDTIRAAHGVFRIVNNNMSNGIRVVSVQRGYDPRDFVLVAFGGNGAIHAGEQARDLGIRRVIVPRLATAFSARGMLHSNIVINKMRTCILRSDRPDLEVVNALFAAMREEIEKELPRSVGDGSGQREEMSFRCAADMHYKGETHEITVPLGAEPQGVVTEEDLDRAVQAFHDAHETLHTFANREDPAYLMNLRLEAVVRVDRPPVRKLSFVGEDPSAALRKSRKVYFEEEGGFRDTPIYEGVRVRCGNLLRGPCVIEEPATTIVVYPGQTARLTELDHYEISAS